MEHKIHAVDLHGLIGLVNQPGGKQDAQAAIDDVFAQAGIYIAFGAARQVASKLVDRTPTHGGAHQHVFTGGFFDKAGRRHDRHFARTGLLR